MKKHIPNILTLGNAVSGSIGVVATLSGFWQWSFYMLLLAALFDFLDGLSARALGVSSPVGKELDSMSDMVSFGVLPGAMMYSMLANSYNLPLLRIEGVLFIPFFAFLITALSALRLAKFNLDTRQTDIFIGLPTPANAIFIGGLLLINHNLCHCNAIHHFAFSTYTLLAITLIMSILLVVELPLLSLKFKNLKWSDNVWRYLLIAGSLVLAIMFIYWIYMAIPLIILWYLLLSIVWNIMGKAPKL